MVARRGVVRYNTRMPRNLVKLLTVCLLLAGCGRGQSGMPTDRESHVVDSQPSRATSQPAAGGDARQSGKAKRADEIRLTVGSWSDLLKMVAGRTGQVVVVDVWSTDCAPCLREFPHFVALHRKYPSRVACISFNTDYYGDKRHPPESLRPSVKKFLAAQGVTFQNVICSEESETLYDRLRLGGPPAVYVFDRTGKLAKRFDNDGRKPGEEFSYPGDVEPFVRKLLTQ